MANRAPVYNLTVEGAHEYFANGILVHNCDCDRYLCMYRDMRARQASYGATLF